MLNIKDTEYKEALCNYIEVCLEYKIPMNSFTFNLYKVSHTPWLVNGVKNIIVTTSHMLTRVVIRTV